MYETAEAVVTALVRKKGSGERRLKEMYSPTLSNMMVQVNQRIWKQSNIDIEGKAVQSG